MRMRWLICILLGTLAWGQAGPGTPPPPAQAAPARPPAPAPQDNSASVPDTAAVLTIDGVCSPKPAAATTAKTSPTPTKTGTAAKTAPAKTPAAGCKTVITKAEFEKLAKDLAPTPSGVTPQMKQQLATMLPQLMATADAAKKKGLDKTPQFEDRLKFIRMRLLSQELQQELQEDAAKISPEDIDKYYKDHAADFEQFNLERLYIPRTKQTENEPKLQDEKNEKATEEAQKAKEAEQKAKAEQNEQQMTELAESLRARAAAGEDISKLQKEAFTAAGMKVESPNVTLNAVRRTSLAPGHSAAFDLKAGEVSQVINDAGGHYIYKLVSTSEMPMQQAQNEIRGKLQGEKMRAEMDKVTNSFKVEKNQAYFGPASASPAPGPRMPGAPGPRPSGAVPGNAGPQPQPPTAPPAPAPNPKPN